MNIKKRIFKTTSVVLVATLVGISSYALVNDKIVKTPTPVQQKRETPLPKKNASKEASKQEKEETVYVFTSSDGSVQNVIVSDWLKNNGVDALMDKSNLENITNVKGDECFLAEGESLTWNAEEKDIYYQGTSQNQPPISMKISYYLNDKEVYPKDLLHQEGDVRIRFDYTNTQKETVLVEEQKEELFVPFAMVTGLLLDNDSFTDITVTNGKLINDGDRSLVVGLTFPGMKENLNLSSDMIEIPDYFEIQAKTTDFSLSNTVSFATNNLFQGLELKDGLDENQISDSISSLDEASLQLVDGSKELHEGLLSLLDKSKEMEDGTKKLKEGGDKLSEGALSLSKGGEELKQGLSSLQEGLDTLSGKNKELLDGAEAVFDGLLSAAENELSSKGLEFEHLTKENYQEVLTDVISSFDKKMIYDSAREKVTEKVKEKEALIKGQVTLGVKQKVLAQIIQPMTLEEYQAALKNGLISQDKKEKIDATLEMQMNSASIQAKIQAETNAQMENIIKQQMNSTEVRTKIENAKGQMKDGTEKIENLLVQLNNYKRFYEGLSQYTEGVETASSGTEKLKDGSRKLSDGAKELSKGAKDLSKGINTFHEGTHALIDGVTKLEEGSSKLQDGMEEFYTTGIEKLVSLLSGDLKDTISRIRALKDVAKEYNSFSGISKDMEGSVKFLYKTDAIQ